MSVSKLDAIRALFQKEKDNKSGNKKNKNRGDFYPFWQMEVDEKSVVRILPDLNQDNPFQFYVLQLFHVKQIGRAHV